MSFDASVMNCADDIAYCTHDLEDIVARRLVLKEHLMDKINSFFSNNSEIRDNDQLLSVDDFQKLFQDSYERKRVIGQIVNMLMTNTEIVEKKEFEHPLLKYRLSISENFKNFTNFLKKEVTYGMVVDKPEIQMLEKKGERIVKRLFEELKEAPKILIPNWDKMNKNAHKMRRISDYIAGMTDPFAIKIYHRLFTPGIGSSRDEL
jgi:dGTPase